MDRRFRLLAEQHHRPGEKQRLAAPARAFQVVIGAETIIMKGKSGKSASFPHRRHQGWHGCTACHHVKDQLMSIDKCGACHNDTMKNTKVEGLKNAVHVMCKRCHIKERAQGRQAAPTQCRGGCHI